MDIKKRCPLCFSSNLELLFKGGKRSYYRNFFHCSNCDLVFVPGWQQPTADEEINRYHEHNNNPENKGYKKFLKKLYVEMEPYLSKNMKGLDYGAGPGPVLAMLMEEKGYDIDIYDPFFHPNKDIYENNYDFITCTEVVEHFHNPREEFDKIENILKSDGWLGVMTSMLDSWKKFPSWHYHSDYTHVVFYSKKTMKWIANKYSWECIFPKKNIVLFHK